MGSFPMGKSIAIFFLLCPFFVLDMCGQDIALVQHEVLTFDSKTKGDGQVLYVHKPLNYDQEPDKRYPVIYVLDPEERFAHTLVAQELLAAYTNSAVPASIIVGVKSTDRYFDFSPKASNDWPVPSFIKKTGGAELFRDYLRLDVIPTIEKKYRTTPFRVLIGHSMGGLFALETLFQQPDLFKAYIVLDPSTFWNNGEIVDNLIAKAKDLNIASGRLFLADGLVPETMEVKLEPNQERLEKYLLANPLPNLVYKYLGLRGELHNEMPFQAVYQGLKAVFFDYRVERPWTLSAQQIADYYTALSAKYGYVVEVPAMLKNRGAGRN
ncbi:alpha/beta hydrolase [Haliscomenobacter hydrossis]|uniref:Esterase n=1 Tax=Haliscomenobacter hydrossis (strain ATCC 27775 / DSM 1100 / LMG 10767 / O) TaxID=760192 RepID=F4L6W6_HALH1|nr:alpha/beta hydrolase [Haliscomenobacter hydrossis]AEE51921.1 esterase [Haliscomenobacter hydrossis DSM 1100]